ncbi:MAG: hypothetical protein KDI62_08075 [Anaerolineae bacterium]|nr:hypothetical protein [Anaerolineae bacterium]MCB9106216.1 hypothetical protein [Anaerolineales bacterium]
MVIVDTSKKRISRNYPRGIIIFLYGLLWLVALLLSFLVTDSLFPAGDSLVAVLGVATWSVALVGGIGSTTAMLSRLYRHLSLRHDFQTQPSVAYLSQPLAGMVAGIISLLLIAVPAALITDFISSFDTLLAALSFTNLLAPFAEFFGTLGSAFVETFRSPAFVSLQLLLAWIAGFYQEWGLKQIKSLGKDASKPGQDSSEGQVVDVDALDENDPFYYKASYYQYRRLLRWSYTWGIFIIIYGLVWFVASLVAFAWGWQALADYAESSYPAVRLIVAALPVAAAGGVGGVVKLLNSLYLHVSVKQDFHLNYLMAYLIQPLVGFSLGLAMYLLIAIGYLTLNRAFSGTTAPFVDVPAVIMLQIVLGWAAGFRQETVTDTIWQITESVVTLIKLILAYFNPVNLFDEQKRAERAKAIQSHLGLFDQVRSSLPTSDADLDWADFFANQERR